MKSGLLRPLQRLFFEAEESASAEVVAKAIPVKRSPAAGSASTTSAAASAASSAQAVAVPVKAAPVAAPGARTAPAQAKAIQVKVPPPKALPAAAPPAAPAASFAKEEPDSVVMESAAAEAEPDSDVMESDNEMDVDGGSGSSCCRQTILRRWCSLLPMLPSLSRQVSFMWPSCPHLRN